MSLEERIASFADLGEIMRNAISDKSDDYSGQLNILINNQYLSNPWFTPDNVRIAVKAIAGQLTTENLTKWTSAYPELGENISPLRAGVVMAGNIPLAGFHDFLCVLISGNRLVAKTSSKDSELIVKIGEILCSINPKFRDKMEFSEGNIENFDLVIATGSNNSSRYFDYYFGKYPNIIRRNRNSIAIIEGNESVAEIKALGEDIFTYFGLGCRNVSKIYIPDGYDVSLLMNEWNVFSDIINHTKYANNYDFNKAVYLVNKEKFHDTGYLLLKEDKPLSSPVSVLHYEKYDLQTAVKQQIEVNSDKIQCVVGRDHIPFGKAQWPYLWDYADKIDTVEFLLKKNMAGIS